MRLIDLDKITPEWGQVPKDGDMICCEVVTWEELMSAPEVKHNE